MEHFTSRLKALIIDAIIVTLFVAFVDNILYIVLSTVKNQTLLAWYPTIVLIIVTMLYFTIFEAKTNKTLGKNKVDRIANIIANSIG